MNPRQSIQKYKLTLFDKYGPDAGNILKAIAWGGLAFGLTAPMFGVLSWKLVNDGTLKPGWAVLVAAVGCIATGCVATFVGLASGGFAGAAWKHLMVNGSSTPYKEQFSIQDAMVKQGRVAEAIASFEQIIAERPTEVDARVKVAELYAREGNHRRAVEIFREAQSIEVIDAGQDFYVSHRLVDLYNGPLGDRGRAIVELRKLIDRHPDSGAASQAREALAKLKEQHLGEVRTD